MNLETPSLKPKIYCAEIRDSISRLVDQTRNNIIWVRSMLRNVNPDITPTDRGKPESDVFHDSRSDIGTPRVHQVLDECLRHDLQPGKDNPWST